MIILVGVTVSTLLGSDGILAKAEEAVKLSEIAAEQEALELIMVQLQMDSYVGNIEDSDYYVGVTLYDKTLANGSIWSIVVITDTQEVYGTGWNYIAAGTTLPNYGETQYACLINYETSEIVWLEEGEYVALDYASSLAVTDDLILNIDPTILEGVSTEELKRDTSVLGNNVELMNFDWTEDSGLTSESFNFDGVDDYIKIKVENEDLTGLLETGLTFEFYRSCLEGSHTYYDGTAGTATFTRSI